MSGRSRDTRSQAVKSLPARPHSAGRRVREEPRHTLTGGQIPAGQTGLGRSPCQGGAATHAHRRSNPCRPDRTRQVAVSGRSRDTRSQAVKSLPARPDSAGRRVREEPRHTLTGGQIPAGQTVLGRSPCQGGAATHVHRRSNPCWPDRTWQVAVSGRSRDRYTCGQPCWPDHTHENTASSPFLMHLHPRNCISPPPLYPERNGQRKIVRQTKELSTITGATYYGLFWPQMPFSPLMKNTAHSAFLELSLSVEGDRDVVCDPPLDSRLTSPSCLH